MIPSISRKAVARAAARAVKDAAKGATLAAAAALLSYALALGAFHRLYYLGILVPLCLVLYLLIAWLVHLRSGGFLKSGEDSEARRAPASSPADDVSPNSSSNLYSSLFAPRDMTIVPRAGPSPRRGPEDERSLEYERSRKAIAALLWAAAWLAIAAAIAYRAAGIGASYFKY
jgi:hypothetical protein